MRCATCSEFPSDYNKLNVSYKQKKSYIMVFGTIAFTTPPGFYLLQVNNRNTGNTRARCKMCVKLTIMTPERRQ